MKFTSAIIAATALFFGAASAQTIADFPPCALSCLVQAIGATGCETTDFKCSCSKSEFVNGSTVCIKGACSEADAKKALEVAVALCKKAGVDIVIPGEPTTPPTSTVTPPKPTETTTPPPTGCRPKFRPRRL